MVPYDYQDIYHNKIKLSESLFVHMRPFGFVVIVIAVLLFGHKSTFYLIRYEFGHFSLHTQMQTFY